MVEITMGTALLAVAAGIAIGFTGLGSSLGQSMVATSSVGAVAEKSEMFAQGVLFSALPETQAIYGFLIAILLIVGGFLGAETTITVELGIVAIAAGTAMGLAGLGSSLGQSMVASSSVGAVTENPDMFAQGILFSALPETQAIYGFLIAILLIIFSGILGG